MVRFGIIGTNFISREFVSTGSTLPGFSVSAVYSRAMDTARAFAGDSGAACLTSLDELAARDDVDAVYIASPNLFHAPQAEQMLRAGKHVLLEKPACPDSETFQRLCRLAREQGVVLLEAMRSVFTPGFAALRQAVREIGPVRQVSFLYCQYSSRYDKLKAGIVENAFNPALCNGALMDIGVYCVHALVELFGPPESVVSLAHRLESGIDVQGGALCRYPSMLAGLSWSKIADGRRQNEIQGEEATLVADSITNPKEILRIGRDGSRRVVYHDPDPEFFGMAHEIAAFLSFASAAPGAGRPWEAHNQVTRQSLALMDEIRRQTGIDFIQYTPQKGE